MIVSKVELGRSKKKARKNKTVPETSYVILGDEIISVGI